MDNILHPWQQPLTANVTREAKTGCGIESPRRYTALALFCGAVAVIPAWCLAARATGPPYVVASRAWPASCRSWPPLRTLIFLPLRASTCRPRLAPARRRARIDASRGISLSPQYCVTGARLHVRSPGPHLPARPRQRHGACRHVPDPVSRTCLPPRPSTRGPALLLK